MVFDYDADSFYTIVIHEYRDGLVARGKLPIGLPLWSHPLGVFSGLSQQRAPP
jgi:hypothetical protein